MKNTINQFLVNIGLIIFGFLSMFSGILMKVGFHGGPHGDGINPVVLGLNHHDWSLFHKVSIIVLSLLMIYHIYKHWKWYKNVLAKKLFRKNIQVLIFSVLFILVTITGLTSWSIDLLEGNRALRRTIIEFHDRSSMILSVFLILHIITRIKWYFKTYKQLRKNNSRCSEN